MNNSPPLFSKIIGCFRGFSEHGFEFAADLIIPYAAHDVDMPHLGRFILVRLSSPDEAVLGRITKMTPGGLLATSEGEDYAVRLLEHGDEAPEELKQRKLKYRVQIKLLGVLLRDDELRFIPSQRRMPHLGAPVAWASDEVVAELCGKLGGENCETDLGDFALGEYVYSGKESADKKTPNTVHQKPQIPVYFNINNLIARRTAVFARAGYGKSNLIKYLVSELYKGEPKTDEGRPVGMLIFDADGEYFWRDNKGRPGLCDVPELCDKISVFTNRPGRGDVYDRWKVGGVKLNLGQLNPGDVLSMALSPERLSQQNVRKMMAMRDDKWRDLIDFFAKSEGIPDDDNRIGNLLGYKTEERIRNNTAEINAAISNIYSVVRNLHDSDSNLINGVFSELKKGGIAIVDISLLSAKAGEIIAGLLMRKIFSHNQLNFIGGGSPLPVIAVIEEAQRVLGGRRLNETSPFVEWVKEGRKYDLGAVMITQQPGALSEQLLSQTDNWFCFHLLSQSDVIVLGKNNSHYSSDILAHMVAEPIIGNCFMWSGHQPFVLPVRIRSFEEKYKGGENKPPTAPAVSKSEGVKKEIDDDLKQFAKKLRDHMKKRIRSASLASIDGMQGVKHGRMFYLINDIKLQGDPRSTNDLKEPLFKLVFEIKPGDDFKKELNGEIYFCASKAAWNKLLGNDESDSE